MKVMIDIPEEFERDLQDKFKEFFERMIADIDYALEKQEPLLCGNYERETAEMFLSAFKEMKVLDDMTIGETFKNIFPQWEYQKENIYIKNISDPFPMWECLNVDIFVDDNIWDMKWSDYHKGVEE